MKFIWLAILAVGLSACTAIQVKPVADVGRLDTVCVANNPKVLVSDFVDVVRSGFRRHGVETTVISEKAKAPCDTVLTYTARRTWDIIPYLSAAELWLWRNNRQIGYAEYHLRGKGSLAPTKWRGTKAKMDPVIDQLLADKPQVSSNRAVCRDDDRTGLYSSLLN